MQFAAIIHFLLMQFTFINFIQILVIHITSCQPPLSIFTFTIQCPLDAILRVASVPNCRWAGCSAPS